MIREIFCSKFKEKSIKFKKGLNVILGDINGANSIGKSSALLAIDYVLGGETYRESEDIISNVQHHEVGVCFCFENSNFYFVHDTSIKDRVFKADENFNKLDETLSLDEYKNFLKEKYQLNMFDCSFRETVGLFMRIYGKGIVNETKPLHEVTEKNKDCIIRLVKILNYYHNIYILKEKLEKLNERKNVYVNALKLNMINAPKNKTEERNIKKRIESINQEIDLLVKELATQSICLDNEHMRIILSIKEQLYIIQNQKNHSYSKIQRYQYNLNQSRRISVVDLDKLKKFFPSIDILEINKINQFHKDISEIVSSDLDMQIQKERRRYEILEAKEKELLNSIDPTIEENDNFKLAIQHLTSLQKELFVLKDSVDCFEKKNLYIKEKSDADTLYNISFQEILTKIQQNINDHLAEYNRVIYGDDKSAPLIMLNPTKYNFKTPNDKGTGAQYSGLLMFDLVMLSISRLPVICHDSFLLKNIEDQTIERILNLYTSFTKKQIFISFDKQNSYSDKTAQILNDNCVLRLAPDGRELYGKSWSRS